MTTRIRHHRTAWLALLGAIGLTLAFTSALEAQVGIQATPEEQQIFASDGRDLDQFGASVAIDGDTLVIGAPAADFARGGDPGAVYVFTRTGDTWTETQQLVASDAVRFNQFGASVAIDGDNLVIGAPQFSVFGNDEESTAYVFTRTGDTWTETQQLTATGRVEGDLFGGSVAIEDDTVIVGAASDLGTLDGPQGSAYVFTQTGNTWTQICLLYTSDAADE